MGGCFFSWTCWCSKSNIKYNQRLGWVGGVVTGGVGGGCGCANKIVCTKRGFLCVGKGKGGKREAVSESFPFSFFSLLSSPHPVLGIKNRTKKKKSTVVFCLLLIWKFSHFRSRHTSPQSNSHRTHLCHPQKKTKQNTTMMSKAGLAMAAAFVALAEGAPSAGTVELLEVPVAPVAPVSSAFGSAPRTAASSIRSAPAQHMTLLSSGVGAWPDLDGSTLRDVPPFMRLMPTTLANWDMATGTTVKFSCPNEPSLIEVCDAWVFFYSCPQSCVTTYQGGLQGQLAALPGWERTQCAPSFWTNAPGMTFVHPMASFRMQLSPGESTQFDLLGNAEFLAFGVDSNGVDCTKYVDESSCSVAGGRCRWETEAGAGVCLNQNCKGRFGPPPPCRECPWEGVVSVARPASDGPF